MDYGDATFITRNNCRSFGKSVIYRVISRPTVAFGIRYQPLSEPVRSFMARRSTLRLLVGAIRYTSFPSFFLSHYSCRQVFP
jgi:hypothetical protein